VSRFTLPAIYLAEADAQVGLALAPDTTTCRVRRIDAAGLAVLASPILFANRRLIFERATALRLPATYQWPEMAREGGLAGYGPSIVQLFRDVLSRQLVKLLEGANPADLPVEQPAKFELVINVNAAKALGLTIPRSMLMLADEVIE
jgi:putative ABC transport system substrate-binding protein